MVTENNMSLIRDVDVTELEVVLKDSKPVLIDFWAPWCTPCVNLMPIVEEVAAAYADSVVVVKLNIADHPDLAGAMEVITIPNLQFFKEGRKLGGRVGFMTKNDIEGWLDECLSKA